MPSFSRKWLLTKGKDLPARAVFDAIYDLKSADRQQNRIDRD